MNNLVYASVFSMPPHGAMPFHHNFHKLQSVASTSTRFSAAVLGVADAEPNTCLTYEYDNRFRNYNQESSIKKGMAE
jgi:hypothetical protein